MQHRPPHSECDRWIVDVELFCERQRALGESGPDVITNHQGRHVVSRLVGVAAEWEGICLTEPLVSDNDAHVQQPQSHLAICLITRRIPSLTGTNGADEWVMLIRRCRHLETAPSARRRCRNPTGSTRTRGGW